MFELRELVDVIFAVGLFLNALLFLPQIWRLLKTRNAEGFSLITFVGFSLLQLSAVAYGYLHQIPELMYGYLLAFVTCGAVTVLLLLLRFNVLRSNKSKVAVSTR